MNQDSSTSQSQNAPYPSRPLTPRCLQICRGWRGLNSAVVEFPPYVASALQICRGKKRGQREEVGSDLGPAVPLRKPQGDGPTLTTCPLCVSEFESWYNESFLIPEEVQAMLRSGGPIRPGLVPVYKALALVSLTSP